MKRVKAPRNSFSRSAASLPALLVLGTLSGSALAATDIAPPCPKTTTSADVLHDFIEHDAVSAIAETVDASETIRSLPVTENLAEDSSAESDDLNSVDEADAKESALPEFTSRLPGVSVNDLPGFRRHMYRTDI